MWVTEASLGVCRGQLELCFSSCLNVSAITWKLGFISMETTQALRTQGDSGEREHWVHMSRTRRLAACKFLLPSSPDQPVGTVLT